MKSIRLSDYFKLLKPKYIILKLIPDTSIRNYNSTSIARTINHLGATLRQRISRDEKIWNIQTPAKCSFMIDIRKNGVDFYFLVPELYETLLREKISEVWPKVTIKKIEQIENFSDDALKYQVFYKSEDPLSLSIDKRCNEPLNSILGVLDIMKEDDRVGIFYNFRPTSQRKWSKQCAITMRRFENNEPLDKELISTKYVFKTIIMAFAEILDGILEGLRELFKKEKKDINLIEVAMTKLIGGNKGQLSPASMKKKDSIVISTQIAVLSESKSKERKINNATAVAQSFYQLNEDNELIYSVLPVKNINYTNYSIGAVDNKFSIEECQNLLELPGKTLLQQFKAIPQVNTLENEVPEQIRNGIKLIGINEYKGNKQKAYLTTDKDYKNLAVVVVGPTRSGKTTFLGNLARNCIDAGECVIVPDFIENCALADEIMGFVPEGKVIEIDLSDLHKLPAFNYCESITDNTDPLYIYDNLKRQANLLGYLINSVNVENKELAPRMDRYLQAAAHIVYAVNGPTIDILYVLEDHVIRERYVNSVPDTLKSYLAESIAYMEQLDEWTKATKDKPAEKVGTHISYVTGILDRFYILKKNTAMEIMMSKKPENCLNFSTEMQKGQLITIKMPESVFPTEEERDIMTTYWITKIYLAGQVRADKIRDKYQRTTVNVITDEIAQLESAERFIGSRLDKTAKFGIKFILSTMYINQLRIREKLRNANTSYILIAGSDKVNYTELKDELSQHGFQLEDLMNLKRFQSLNYIKYENGYTAFISWLPKPLKEVSQCQLNWRN